MKIIDAPSQNKKSLIKQSDESSSTIQPTMIEQTNHNNEEVSVILVDPADQVVGYAKKTQAHQLGQLHRAFSIFIFSKDADNHGLLLIQKRHPQKYHCGGLWTNSCCSHPYPGEPVETAALRRLKEELGFTTLLKKVGAFQYKAALRNGLIEHEYDHVFNGFLASPKTVPYNPEEIAEVKWINVMTLKQLIKQTPDNYTPWLAEGLSIALSSFSTSCYKKTRA